MTRMLSPFARGFYSVGADAHYLLNFDMQQDCLQGAFYRCSKSIPHSLSKTQTCQSANVRV